MGFDEEEPRVSHSLEDACEKNARNRLGTSEKPVA
jgi:hypothetical protein